MKYRWVVLSDDCGWQIFSAGHTRDRKVADEQCDIFRKQYPDRVFQVHEQEK